MWPPVQTRPTDMSIQTLAQDLGLSISTVSRALNGYSDVSPATRERVARRAAELGHAKSMNLVGRYLEEGRYCPADPAGAVEWYRRSAQGGDFRGQFSYAAVLADAGRIDEAVDWLQQALAGGNLNFLRVACAALLNATHPKIRELAQAYQRRAAQLADERDGEQLADLA